MRCVMGLETILIGAGIEAATAASIASAAGTAATVAGIAGPIVGGIQQKGAAEAAASATSREAQRQADLRQEEATKAARVEARENIELEKIQKLSFLKSGVALEGSPLLLLAETKTRGAENIESIIRSGQTGATGLLASGTTKASQLRASGREALLGGLLGGATRAEPLFRTTAKPTKKKG